VLSRDVLIITRIYECYISWIKDIIQDFAQKLAVGLSLCHTFLHEMQCNNTDMSQSAVKILKKQNFYRFHFSPDLRNSWDSRWEFGT